MRARDRSAPTVLSNITAAYKKYLNVNMYTDVHPSCPDIKRDIFDKKAPICNFDISPFPPRVFRPIFTDEPVNWKCSFAPIKIPNLRTRSYIACRDKIASGNHRARSLSFSPLPRPATVGKLQRNLEASQCNDVPCALMCADGNQAWRCTHSRSTDKRIKHPVMESAPNHALPTPFPPTIREIRSVVWSGLGCAGGTFSLETRYPSRTSDILRRFHFLPPHSGRSFELEPTYGSDPLPKHGSRGSFHLVFARENAGKGPRACFFAITSNAILKLTSINFLLKLCRLFRWIIHTCINVVNLPYLLHLI